MTCSACYSGIERVVGKMDGVNKVEVSLMGKCMTVDYDESAVTEQAIFDAVSRSATEFTARANSPKARRLPATGSFL